MYSVRLDSVCVRSVRVSRGGGGRRSVGVEIPVPSISQTKIITIGLSSTCPLKNATMANVLDRLA